MTSSLLIGDAVERLREMPDESVHCCVTSPPYWGLRDYGTAMWHGGKADCQHRASHLPRGVNLAKSRASVRGGGLKAGKVGWIQYRDVCGDCGAERRDSQLGLEKTPELYVANMVAVFREVRRVLRSDGTCWINIGDSYASNGSGSAQSGLKTLSDIYSPGKNPRANHRYQDCAATVIRQTPRGYKPKDLIGIPWLLAFALRADGWFLRSEIIWSKPNPMPESVTDRPTKSHEQIFLLSKSRRYFYDMEAVKESASHNTHARRARVNGHHKSIPDKMRNGIRPPGVGPKAAETDSGVRYNKSFSAAVVDVVNSRNKRTVWEMSTKPFPGSHFATFPPELAETCIKAGTSEKGCCARCGAPIARLLRPTEEYAKKLGKRMNGYDYQADKVTGMSVKEKLSAEYGTVGWKSDCNCPLAPPEIAWYSIPFPARAPPDWWPCACSAITSA